MAAIPYVGKLFVSSEQFLSYLESLAFKAWRPQSLTLHHTGAPTLELWKSWQVRAKPVTDQQWLMNLAGYYGGLGWRSGPHFFVTPRHIGVLTPPTERGVHAHSFNATSWGMEVVGNFDFEAFEGEIKEKALGAIAACNVAMGWQAKDLLFHRDDPRTNKTCPGKRIKKEEIVRLVEIYMGDLVNDGDHPEEHIREDAEQKPIPRDEADIPTEAVTETPGDTLTLRLAASAKSPSIWAIPNGTRVAVLGKADNAGTEWARVWLRGRDGVARVGWVAARFLGIAK